MFQQLNYMSLSILLCQQEAISRGGRLLSSGHLFVKDRLSWQCKEGHTWKALWGNIKLGTWCPICQQNKSKPDILVLQQHASSRDGKLVSTTYINNFSKLVWQCNKGHQWSACWSSVKAGHWCPKCSNNATPDINDLREHANRLGGKLLSKKYINNNKPLRWSCKHKHVWEVKWNSIKDGNTWCPECSRFKTELSCKLELENRFNITFLKHRFTYNNKRYEFDGYNEQHKVAFEYHGYQHYIYPNHWHKTEDIFNKAIQRDRDKEQYCIDNDIKLIVIPFSEENNIKSYVLALPDL